MLKVFFFCYILFGFYFYYDFMCKLEEVGGIENVFKMISSEDLKDIDINSSSTRFLIFLMFVLLWPLLIKYGSE